MHLDCGFLPLPWVHPLAWSERVWEETNVSQSGDSLLPFHLPSLPPCLKVNGKNILWRGIIKTVYEKS